jgi:Helix-turn-helix domain
MKVTFDPELFQPLIAQIVIEILAQLEADEARLGNRMAYPEPEAAALLGVAPHVLRDCRRREELSATLCGKRFLYERTELLRFLREGRRTS